MHSVPRVSTSQRSGDHAPEFHTYPTYICSNTHTTSTHHRHLYTTSHSNSAYSANGNHISTAPTIPKICALCMPVGRQCLINYQLPVHPEQTDPEEEKDLSKQQKEEEQEKEEEDGDSTKQKQKGQELKK